MPEYEVGKRYPMTAKEAATVMRVGWPIVSGTPDLTRGRLFVKAPGSWAFWTTDGRKVTFDVLPDGGHIVSQSKKPDPERPEPLP
jgi:hypothetical protein